MRRGSSALLCARSAVRIAVLGLLLLVVGAGAGCLGAPRSGWGSSMTEEEIEAALAPLPPEARRQLMPLSEVFYERITSRRFNSLATFEDPSLRRFFPSVSAYSDYYAALADALDRAHVRFTRPQSITLLGIESLGNGSLRLALRFVGENDLPLRWWSASLEREDEWQWRQGQWWLVPGKV
ncbi:MAG: hypothetical protein ACX98W_02320 [bacterium]